MYLNVCASFSWDKEQNYIKCERKKKEDKLLGAREVCRFDKFQLSSFPCLLGSISNDDGDGNENGKKSNRLRLAKQLRTSDVHHCIIVKCFNK